MEKRIGLKFHMYIDQMDILGRETKPAKAKENRMEPGAGAEAGGFRGYTLPDNDSGAKIKVPLHNVEQFSFTLVWGSVVKDRNRERMGNSNGIGHLKQHMGTYIVKQ